MKLRATFLILFIFLTLSSSADRKSNLCASCWRAAPDSVTVDQTLGVNIHFTDARPGELKMIAAAGFRWVRMDFKWDLTEQKRGQYDFSAYDRLMKSLDEFGIHALFILDYGNPLYGGTPPRTAAARQAFANWAVAAARHFSQRGVLWEIYNEPNLKMFWPSQPNAGDYAALAATVGRAFRSSVPNERLIAPATSGIDSGFLESCFKADLLEYSSAVSVHPYRQSNPESAAPDYAKLRELISRYRTPTSSEPNIISSEWGYSSAWREINEEQQAGLVARMFLTNAANGVPISIWYDWRDDGDDQNEPEDHFGLVRNRDRSDGATVFEPKPAYLAMQTLSKHLSGYHFIERLAVGSDDDYVLVFGKDSDRRIAAWTTASPHRVAIPVRPGPVVVISATGQTTRTIVTESTLNHDLSTAVTYLMCGQ